MNDIDYQIVYLKATGERISVRGTENGYFYDEWGNSYYHCELDFD